mmetsp:Transcript_37043/g.44790  ORF Transcript_37043/g.44790 Transcript_37043/m.44790 type:complete len:233 (+) Transcript_37043:178-876(+)
MAKAMAPCLSSSASTTHARVNISRNTRATAKVCHVKSLSATKALTSSSFTPSTHDLNRCTIVSRRTLGITHGVTRASSVDKDIDILSKDPQDMTLGEKFTAAFRIFFPVEKEVGARTEAKQRLRMILVADRCNMNPRSMQEMKQSIVEAVSDYVEVDEQTDVDLDVQTDPDMGTIYKVQVPVRRVKDRDADLEEVVEEALIDDIDITATRATKDDSKEEEAPDAPEVTKKSY